MPILVRLLRLGPPSLPPAPWALGVLVRLTLLLCVATSSTVWGLTATPGPPPTPLRTGDLGYREIRGHVYDLSGGPDALIAGAAISYGSEAGGGVVRSDERGDFAFTLFLHDTHHVRITAEAAGYESSAIALSAVDAVYRFPTVELGLLPTQSGHRLAGHLSSDVFCTRDADGIAITLEPTGRSTLVAADGTFAFEQVSDGEYVLHIETGDFDVPVTLAGGDVLVQFCINCANALVITPQGGAPGTAVTAEGLCYALHSGRLATIYFDDAVVAEAHGDTPGAFRTSFAVPLDAAPGPHRVRLVNTSNEIASTQFVVRAAGASCAGDCDRDAVVTVAELVRGIGLALGVAGAACPVYDSASVDIAQLIAAVDSALNGCPAPGAIARR